MSWMQPSPQPVPGMPPQKFPGQQPSPDFPIASAGKMVNGSDPMWPGGPTWDQLKQQNGGYPMPSPQPWTPNEHWTDGGNSEGPGGFTGQNQDPNFGQLGTIGAGPYGNRGSGQPINQPVGGGALAGLGMQVPVGGTPTSSQINAAWANMPGGQPPQSGYVDPSSLISRIAGGAGLSQSDMVTLQGPDGTTKAVPRSEAAHWLSKGATMASGVGNAVRGMF
jgi:hypothetical protein